MLGNNVFEGELKPGKPTYNSVDLGLTTENIVLESEKEYVELIAAQYGTKMYDAVKTGEIWFCTMSLTGYSIAQLAEVLTSLTVSAGGNAGKIGGTDCYESLYDKAKLLTIKRVSCDNTVETDEDYWINFPKAYPMNDSDILTLGPSEQESFEVKFMCFRDRTAGSASLGYFGWSGQASTALA